MLYWQTYWIFTVSQRLSLIQIKNTASFYPNPNLRSYRNSHACLAVHSKNKTPVLGNAIPVLRVKQKRGCNAFWLFFKVAPCSAISSKRSWRELFIDVTEQKSVLKNRQNTHSPCFSFIPKTGIAFPKTGGFLFTVFCFSCDEAVALYVYLR